MPRDSDVRGPLLYISNYSTKIEQTLGCLAQPARSGRTKGPKRESYAKAVLITLVVGVSVVVEVTTNYYPL